LSPRRVFLQQLALLAGAVALPACGATPAAVAPTPSPVLPPALRLPPLPDLVTGASLSWLLIARPKTFTAVPAIDAALRRLVPDNRRELFRRVSGIQLDRIEHLVVAAYPESTLFIVDGVADPLEAERLYRERLMSAVTRSERRYDLVLLRGKSASGTRRSLAAMGANVVAIEAGGWLHTKVAALYAEGRLKRTPRALELPDVRLLVDRFGDAPLTAFAPGPFEGEWRSALHGVLGVCTAIGASVRLGEGTAADVDFAFCGDWDGGMDQTLDRLVRSWDDIAQSSFGRLTGLSEPLVAPRTHFDQRVIGLSVTVDAARFAEGLFATVRAEARDLMQL